MKGNFATIINEDKPVIVDFHAVWCAPCRMQTPVLRELARDLGNKVRVIKIDVDQNQEIASQYGIQSVPTLIMFRNGKPVWRQSGVVTKNQLKDVLTKNY
jgi:thioredoxin 1